MDIHVVGGGGGQEHRDAVEYCKMAEQGNNQSCIIDATFNCYQSLNCSGLFTFVKGKLSRALDPHIMVLH